MVVFLSVSANLVAGGHGGANEFGLNPVASARD